MGAPLDMPRPIAEEKTELLEPRSYQRLIMPINQATLRLGYAGYGYTVLIKYKGYSYNQSYGWNIVGRNGDTTVWGSGNSKVIAAGKDANLGYVAVVHYDACERYNGDHTTAANKYPSGIIIRYFHMSSVKVQAGQRITKDNIIGYIGATGKQNLFDYNRVHIELDYDISYPQWSPYLLNHSMNQGDIIKKGTSDTLILPYYVLHKKESAPDNQSFVKSGAQTSKGYELFHEGEVNIKTFENKK